MPIQPSDFVKAFEHEWDIIAKQPPQEAIDAYRDSTKWTKYILGKDGFLSRVMDGINNKLGLVYKTEWYTLDALYISGDDLFKDKKMYPSQLQVLIEHENGNNIEEEMWKLIFWRSPLKVIIFYDYPEYEKCKNPDKKGSWLDAKLKILENMLKKANAFFPENADTNYLFIVGNRECEEDKLPQWRSWEMNNERIRPIPSP